MKEKKSTPKRRDSKGRILRDGESQRKDGRYAFVYTVNGSQKFVYSWKLEETDPLPAGRRKCEALRTKERRIKGDIDAGIIPNGGEMTVLQLVQKYVGLKTGVTHNTLAGYNTVINVLKKEEFGSLRIDKVKLSDAKTWLIKLQKVDGRSYSSIHNIRGVVRPAFQMAVDDDLLRKNPFEFQLATVVVNDSVTREAITRKQERRFLEFIKNDEHFSRYYEGMFILFKTGLRISEFCGLTMADIDFEEKSITIDHQLQRTRQGVYVIENTKTKSGERTIPMTDEVYEAFQNLVAKRGNPKVEPFIVGSDGKIYTKFLSLDKKNMPEVALHWINHFRWALAKYNRIYKDELPKITPHVCRHTYCSNMAKSGMNPKTLQYLMGHSDISVTLNVYTHIEAEDAKEELARLAKLA